VEPLISGVNAAKQYGIDKVLGFVSLHIGTDIVLKDV